MKETARSLWSYTTRGWARRAWTKLIAWMARSRLKPMLKVSRTLREHLWGIINAVVLGVTNAHLEAVNANVFGCTRLKHLHRVFAGCLLGQRKLDDGGNHPPLLLLSG